MKKEIFQRSVNASKAVKTGRTPWNKQMHTFFLKNYRKKHGISTIRDTDYI